MKPQTRRNFYSVAIAVLGGIMATILGWPAAAYLLMKPKSGRKDDWAEVSDLSHLLVGKPHKVIYTRRRVDGWRVSKERTAAWVVKTGREEAVAFSPQCTHLGCAYHWEESGHMFLCPCHGSAFSIDGKVMAGPAPRPLDRYCVRVESGKLLLSSQLEKT